MKIDIVRAIADLMSPEHRKHLFEEGAASLRTGKRTQSTRELLSLVELTYLLGVQDAGKELDDEEIEALAKSFEKLTEERVAAPVLVDLVEDIAAEYRHEPEDRLDVAGEHLRGTDLRRDAFTLVVGLASMLGHDLAAGAPPITWLAERLAIDANDAQALFDRAMAAVRT